MGYLKLNLQTYTIQLSSALFGVSDICRYCVQFFCQYWTVSFCYYL